MVAVFAIWIVELIAHRWGASYLKRRGLKSHDPHSSKGGNEISHTPHGQHVPETTEEALARQDEIERIRTIQEGAGAERTLSRTPSGEVTGKLVDLEDGLAGSDSNKDSTLASPWSSRHCRVVLDGAEFGYYRVEQVEVVEEVDNWWKELSMIVKRQARQ